ncbi:MAG: hypothetical protein JNN04_09940 [Cyclobacteriaceae bacterium]|nr:hypothetical protein [Cyclobacteriaceae bacterium]
MMNMEDCVPEQAENTGFNGRDERGRFIVGNAGRPPMSQGKISKIIRECFAEFLRAKVQDTNELEKIYQDLTAKEKARFLIEIKSFNVPKLQSVGIREEGEQKAVINFSKLSEAALKEVLANTTTNE